MSTRQTQTTDTTKIVPQGRPSEPRGPFSLRIDTYGRFPVGDPRVLIERMSECVRRVEPPVRVWIDVARLLAPDRDHVYRDTPTGLELTFEVLGWLGGWAQRGDGGWLALVRYPLAARDGSYQTEVTHFVPAYLVRRYTLVRNQRHARGGLGH